MKIIVLSAPGQIENEIRELLKMFDLGLQHFHIRKPRFSRKQMAEYINAIPTKYHKKLILHSYHGLAFKYKLGGIHLSRTHRKRGQLYAFSLWLKRRLYPSLVVTRTFHKLTDISNDRRKYSYCLLGPVFDSISHAALSAGFSKRALLNIIPQARQPVYAMGGISEDNVQKAAEYGFQGVALLGTIWESKTLPHEKYAQLSAIALAMQPNQSNS